MLATTLHLSLVTRIFPSNQYGILIIICLIFQIRAEVLAHKTINEIEPDELKTLGLPFFKILPSPLKEVIHQIQQKVFAQIAFNRNGPLRFHFFFVSERLLWLGFEGRLS